MEDPNFPVTITVGGNGQTYKFAAFPNQIHANQSFELVATLQKTDLSAYDLTSATATLYVSGWKNEIGATMLASGVIVSNVITFTVAKDLIPESLGTLPLRNPGNSVFYFIVEDTDSTLQFFQQVNVLDTDYTLDGTVESSPSTITPDKNDLGTVTQVNLNTPPGSPSFQDAYIIGTSPTGDWASNANDLAVYNGSSWVFYDTVEGNFVFDLNTSRQQIFNGTIWQATANLIYSDGESINDNNSNELITFGVAASAVNNPKFSNAATGNAPTIEAIGDDTNIDLDVNAKGTGEVNIKNATFQDNTDATKEAGFDLSNITTATKRTITIPDQNIDLTPSTGTFGDVAGPASSTDNGLVTFDSTTGKLIQDNTGVTVSDSGAFNGVESLTLDEISTPSTPSSGKHVSYFDADNDMVMLDDTGDERFHQGTAFQEDQFTYVANPRGASYRIDGSPTGAIKITLPVSWTQDMLDFDLNIFDYTNKIQETHKIGGYNQSTTTQWINERAVTVAGQSRRVRFGHDGTKCCIIIGETTDSWSYPRVNVENLRLHLTSPSLEDWKSGWTISIESDVTTGYDSYTGDLYSKHANTSDLTNYTPTGTTETIDWSKGEIQELDLNSATGTVTLTFSNPIEGQNYYLKIIQGSTSRNVTLPSTVLTPGGTAPTTITVTASNDAIDTIRMIYDGTNYLAEINQNYG